MSNGVSMLVRSRGGSSITFLTGETLPGNTVKPGYELSIPRGSVTDVVSPLTVNGTVSVRGTLDIK